MSQVENFLSTLREVLPLVLFIFGMPLSRHCIQQGAFKTGIAVELLAFVMLDLYMYSCYGTLWVLIMLAWEIPAALYTLLLSTVVVYWEDDEDQSEDENTKEEGGNKR